MTTDTDGSADQTAWMELAQAVRTQLLKYAQLIPAMKHDELKAFVETCREARLLEEEALTFDRDVELREQRQTYDG